MFILFINIEPMIRRVRYLPNGVKVLIASCGLVPSTQEKLEQVMGRGGLGLGWTPPAAQ